MKHSEKIFLIIISLVALFLCVFRIRETYILAEDVARDTYKVLTLWQNKEIVLVGPPASFSLTSEFKFYFGSISYYLGMIGLILTGFDPSGATIPTIILFILSIPFFFRFLQNIGTSTFVRTVGTVLYSFSPLVISHMRFFWNPNTVIPLSVFFWYLVSLKNKAREFEVHFGAGLVAAVIFNLHYFTVIPLLTWMLICLAHKEWNKFTGMISGLFIGSLPLMIYELTSNFYLSQALRANFENRTPGTLNIPEFLGRAGETFMAVLGLKHAEIYFPTLLGNTSPLFWFVLAALFLLALFTIWQKHKEKRMVLVAPMFIAIFFAMLFSHSVFYARYVFGAVPLVIWFIAEMMDGKFRKWLLIPVGLAILVSNFGIVTFKNNLPNGYLPLEVLEKASGIIVDDDFRGEYNLSENTDGDAYAMALRFYVQRDATKKPNSTDKYGWLDRLYVLAPSIERIRKDNFYEFYASGPWSDPVVSELGEVKLFRFDK